MKSTMMTRPFLIILVFLFFLLPLSALGHGVNYLEFNPDYFRTRSLNVSTSGAVYEIFLPVNEFLSGFDLWFDNSGSAGLASFELWNGNGQLIATKGLTISHIDPISGGQRTHIDLNSQISVVAGNKHRLKISSTMPELQIYYSDRIKFLGHNEPHLSDYLNGAAEVNGEEKEFSFKYALYETVESSAPSISNIGWTVISPEQMRIDFNVNEPIDYRIEYGISGQGYGQSTNFIGEYRFCVQGTALCSILVSVFPDFEYQYTLTVKDSWGNQSQTVGTFESGQGQTSTSTPTPTLSPTGSVVSTPTESPSASPTSLVQDEVPPAISNLRIAEVSPSSVEIAWTTNEAANSHLLISTPFLITITDSSDPTLELEHLLKVGNVLGPNTNYIATITSMDLGSNSSRASISFKTLSSIPSSLTGSPKSPTQPSPQSQEQSKITTESGSGSSAVSWSVPQEGEPSGGYRIDVFDKEGNLMKSILIPSGTLSSEISGLEDGDYTVIVYSNEDGVFEKVDQPAQFNVDTRPFFKKILDFWPYLLIAVAFGGVLLWLKNRKKTSQLPQQVI